jgi:hypothetical protein
LATARVTGNRVLLGDEIGRIRLSAKAAQKKKARTAGEIDLSSRIGYITAAVLSPVKQRTKTR